MTIDANGEASWLEEGEVAGEDEAPGAESRGGIFSSIFAGGYARW